MEPIEFQMTCNKPDNRRRNVNKREKGEKLWMDQIHSLKCIQKKTDRILPQHISFQYLSTFLYKVASKRMTKSQRKTLYIYENFILMVLDFDCRWIVQTRCIFVHFIIVGNATTIAVSLETHLATTKHTFQKLQGNWFFSNRALKSQNSAFSYLIPSLAAGTPFSS